MTAISGTSTDNAFAQQGLAATQAARRTQLGQADFLRLMTEQLKNQDPLKPLEGTQMLGQLAQFSTVQGIENMQNALGAVASVMESDQTLRAAALVGHDALVEASTLDLQAGAGVRGEIVATGAGPVQIDIVDASGQVVRRMSVQADAAGAVPYAWDGRTGAGAAAPAGRYTVRATSGTGSDAQALAVRLAARVDSVSIEPTGLTLNLAGLGSHPLSAVRRIG
ncbi:flagellar hook assembly protein FlgD [Lysobacter sp. N42]|jgi:flagellar basal-body rod modification protein FlgD|uniref:flagellar hook assembly protein FlgD n=1 Tax=Lysobacter sp. N42 TaxID=2545719 RepID=UPI001052F2FA|nr:flagellar hook capping FlgD N-terminal domain-containing protein [Lysobacter sp. N42]TCZ80470.1 flagellar basal body rod modification protein [Lysobacter sp. N42]